MATGGHKLHQCLTLGGLGRLCLALEATWVTSGAALGPWVRWCTSGFSGEPLVRVEAVWRPCRLTREALVAGLVCCTFIKFADVYCVL